MLFFNILVRIFYAFDRTVGKFFPTEEENQNKKTIYLLRIGNTQQVFNNLASLNLARQKMAEEYEQKLCKPSSSAFGFKVHDEYCEFCCCALNDDERSICKCCQVSYGFPDYRRALP